MKYIYKYEIAGTNRLLKGIKGCPEVEKMPIFQTIDEFKRFISLFSEDNLRKNIKDKMISVSRINKVVYTDEQLNDMLKTSILNKHKESLKRSLSKAEHCIDNDYYVLCEINENGFDKNFSGLFSSPKIAQKCMSLLNIKKNFKILNRMGEELKNSELEAESE